MYPAKATTTTVGQSTSRLKKHDAKQVKKNVPPPADDDRISVVFIGEGGGQNGRMAEILNAAGKDNLPLLIIVIDTSFKLGFYFLPAIPSEHPVLTEQPSEL